MKEDHELKFWGTKTLNIKKTFSTLDRESNIVFDLTIDLTQCNSIQCSTLKNTLGVELNFSEF